MNQRRALRGLKKLCDAKEVAYGYALVTDEKKGWASGSLYPALKALVKRGFVTREEVPSPSGRRYRVLYTITETGYEWITEHNIDNE